MLEIIILSIILLVLIGFNIRANIWYREELKCLDEVRKQYEKLSKECDLLEELENYLEEK